MSKDVIIIGGGGHGCVLIDALMLANIPIKGICDVNLPTDKPGPFGFQVVGNDDDVLEMAPDSVDLVNGIGSTGSMDSRDEIYSRFQEAGFNFISVVHPSAIVSPHARLEGGCQVMAGAVIQCGVVVGANSIVNTGATLDHDCKIGRSVHIAPGVTLSGNVVIEDCCHIGTGANIIQGTHVGKNSLIGAGVVVKSDIEAGSSVT